MGWMIIIHISHACISVCDGLQRRAVLLLNEFSRTMAPHSKVSAGTLPRGGTKPVRPHHCNSNDNDHSSHPTSTVVPLGIYCKTQFKQDLSGIITDTNRNFRKCNGCIRGDFQMHKCAGAKQEYKANKNTNDNCHIRLFKRIDTFCSQGLDSSASISTLFHLVETVQGVNVLLNKGFYIAFSQTCIVSASKISEIFVEIVISIEHQWLLNIE